MAACAARTKVAATCARSASRIVQGEPFCWQHAEAIARPWTHWEAEERALAMIDQLARTRPVHWTLRLRWWIDEHFGHSEHLAGSPCVYCGRRAMTRRIAVHPRSLSRSMYPLCGRESCVSRLRTWEGSASARRARSHADWEAEHGIPTPLELIHGIPPQYPSISRRTLRAFIDSGLEHATIPSGEVSALNGTIRTLGFGDEVYAEQRSGETVLRRIAESAAA